VTPGACLFLVAFSTLVPMANRGPRTERGKAASSRNSIKPCPERPLKRRGSRRDGLRSGAPVIPELESFEEWERHRAGTIASFAPEGYSETDFAERIASLSWRLKRVARYETEMTAHYLDDIPEDMANAAGYAERALKIPREMTITPDEIDKQFSRRLLPPEQTLERIMRGACPERSRTHAADVEGKRTCTARSPRPCTSWRRCSRVAKATTLRLPVSTSAARLARNGTPQSRPRTTRHHICCGFQPADPIIPNPQTYPILNP